VSHFAQIADTAWPTHIEDCRPTNSVSLEPCLRYQGHADRRSRLSDARGSAWFASTTNSLTCCGPDVGQVATLRAALATAPSTRALSQLGGGPDYHIVA
jgi:hypothetical protein